RRWLNNLSQFDWLSRRGNGLDRRRFQRINRSRCQLDGRREHRLIGFLGQLDGSRLRVHEFLTPFTPWVKPCPQCFRLSGGPFAKRYYSLISRVQTVVRDCKDGGEDMSFVLIEDLNDMAVRL